MTHLYFTTRRLLTFIITLGLFLSFSSYGCNKKSGGGGGGGESSKQSSSSRGASQNKTASSKGGKGSSGSAGSEAAYQACISRCCPTQGHMCAGDCARDPNNCSYGDPRSTVPLPGASLVMVDDSGRTIKPLGQSPQVITVGR